MELVSLVLSDDAAGNGAKDKGKRARAVFPSSPRTSLPYSACTIPPIPIRAHHSPEGPFDKCPLFRDQPRSATRCLGAPKEKRGQGDRPA